MNRRISRTTRVILDRMTVKYFIQQVFHPVRRQPDEAVRFDRTGLPADGIALGAFTCWMKLSQGTDMTGNPLLLLTVMSVIMGVQFLFFGMPGELCSRIYFAAQNQTNDTIRRTWNFDESSIPMQQSRRAA
jgi:hypothetical protein